MRKQRRPYKNHRRSGRGRYSLSVRVTVPSVEWWSGLHRQCVRSFNLASISGSCFLSLSFSFFLAFKLFWSLHCDLFVLPHVTNGTFSSCLCPILRSARNQRQRLKRFLCSFNICFPLFEDNSTNLTLILHSFFQPQVTETALITRLFFFFFQLFHSHKGVHSVNLNFNSFLFC